MRWFENDELWTAFAPYMFAEERMRTAPAEVDRILALVGSAPSDVWVSRAARDARPSAT